MPAPRIAVANSAAPIFLIDSKSYLPFVSPAASTAALSLAQEAYPVFENRNAEKETGACSCRERVYQGHGTRRKAPGEDCRDGLAVSKTRDRRRLT